jgi:hypothetical protein
MDQKANLNSSDFQSSVRDFLAGDLVFRQIQEALAFSPADKMHDLQPIAIREQGVGPLRSRNYGAVVFDGDTVAFQTKVGDQFLKMSGRRQARKLTRLAIDYKMHTARVSPDSALSGFANRHSLHR